jgi:hypothetical protein
MEANTIKQNLQPLDAFFIKIIQLYEMIIVRHGLMLVGQVRDVSEPYAPCLMHLGMCACLIGVAQHLGVPYGYPLAL